MLIACSSTAACRRVVDPRRAAEVGARDHKRLDLQPLGLEVGEQGDHRLIQDRGWARRPLEIVAGCGPASRCR